MTRVVILGCGYVGCALAGQLTDSDVVGVRRSDAGLAAVEAAGGRPVQADVTVPDALEAVPDADWLVFAASAGGRDAEAARDTYVEGLKTAIDHFAARSSPPERIVYTSSTGVYGDHDGAQVDEDTALQPTTEKTRVLVEAERIARQRPPAGIDGTVARFGGLYGPDRYRLERYLDGPVTAGHLNMVHREDAAGAVRFLLEANHGRNAVVNVVDDEPVEKWAFADWLASQCEEPDPPKETLASRLEAVDSDQRRQRLRANKRVSNDRLRELGYEFAYPTFREGYRDAIAQYLADSDET
ncbi:SDR family oxidoreductase [Halorhabdus sp. CBA1104]|uniref:SDR family oxidoreductase n=1 Tax=unclassified Halorhabdus TaxID=2621901 RepID=UPI0012B37233|nr:MULTISPECIES: SDR family oxidoreductase [unclassified Halorhabdus]QGN07563.1 SDR family oxidoreductase [Halorhabdus sp. CBA1104]